MEKFRELFTEARDLDAIEADIKAFMKNPEKDDYKLVKFEKEYKKAGGKKSLGEIRKMNEGDKSFYREDNLHRFLGDGDTAVKVEKNGKKITVYRFGKPSLVMDIKNNVIHFSSTDFDNVDGIKSKKVNDADLELIVMRNLKAASNEDIYSSDFVKKYMHLDVYRP